MKWKVFWLVGLVFCVAQFACADERISLKAGYQLLAPEGEIGGTVDDRNSYAVDIDDSLNLSDSEGFSGEIALNLGNSRFSLNYLPIAFSGTGTLSDTIEINGETFSASTRVKTDLDLDVYDIGYTYFLVNTDDLPTRIQLGLELAVKIADANLAVRESNGNVSASESLVMPIPTVGARARLALADYLGVSGRLGYMEVAGNYFMDAEAQVEFSPLPMFGLYAGIRYFDLKIDEDDIYVDTQMAGPFGGLMVRF